MRKLRFHEKRHTGTPYIPFTAVISYLRVIRQIAAGGQINRGIPCITYGAPVIRQRSPVILLATVPIIIVKIDNVSARSKPECALGITICSTLELNVYHFTVNGYVAFYELIFPDGEITALITSCLHLAPHSVGKRP